jgi:hypothetical protein
MNEKRLDLDALIARLRDRAASFVVESDEEGLARQRTTFRQVMREAADALAAERERAEALALIIEQVKDWCEGFNKPEAEPYTFADEMPTVASSLAAIVYAMPSAALVAAHDAEVKAQGQASALRQISNAVRDPDKLMGLSPHALADALWAEAEEHDPVENARARAAAIREAK